MDKLLEETVTILEQNQMNLSGFKADINKSATNRDDTNRWSF